MVREYTNKLSELIQEEYLSNEQVLNEMLCFFSEDTIKDFCLNGFAGELTDDFKGCE